jgi:hypothetical protein
MNTHKPDSAELITALAGAEQMRAEGNDPRHIAMSLRYLHERCRGLEELLLVTDRFLRFGMPEHELTEMRRLVAHLREEERLADHRNNVHATLPL